MTSASAAVRRCHKVFLTAFTGFAISAGAAVAAHAQGVAELSISAPRPMLYWASEKYGPIPPAPKVEAPASPADAVAAAGGPVSEAERQCLAEAVYYESRGDKPEGQRAIADVIVRRTKTRPFPTTICGVVSQKVGRTCQFAYACNGPLKKPYEPEWRASLAAADYELYGPGRFEDLTGSATFFHAARVTTNWKARYVMTRRVGAHVFYRMTDKAMRAYKNKLPAS